MNKFETRVLSVMKGKNKPPMSAKQLAKKLGIRKAQKEEFMAAIGELKSRNKLIEHNGAYLLAENAGLAPALVIKVNATFGFVRPVGGDKDVFVPGRFLLGAMPGDTVLVRQRAGTGGQLPEGEVIKVTEQARQKFSGVLRHEESGWVIVPDNYVKFPLRVNPKSVGKGVKDGDKVIAEIDSQGGRHSQHTVRVLESFGSAESAAACCRAVLAAEDIPTEFPAEVLEQAAAIGAGSGIHPKELAARLDLRDEIIFTIDGADSKDLDDAISLEKTQKGWGLGVHIADVSYYVTPQSPLDLEAFARGTSVYYADSVIPMLPPELSNGICSLNPQEDRLAFSALISLSDEGEMLGYSFKKTVIRSRVKGIYSEVNSLLDGSADEAVRRKYAGLEEVIGQMRTLAGILTANRMRRGGMELDTVESKIIVGPDGRAADVQARERGESERIIEELMLTANEAAATFALEKALPFVFRVHEAPALDKVAGLFDVLDRLGIKAKRPKAGITSARLASILDKAKGTDAEPVIGTMVLRTMAKAKYSPQNIGHFGLSLDNYTHFTSPIRRYPDLTIHRILSSYVNGMKEENIKKRYGGFVARSAERSTLREIAAMTAERSCEDCYKAEYMTRFIGQEFDGVITGATAFGVYVRLNNTVEGLCGVRDFPAGDWQYDGSISFVEAVSGKRLRLGDGVRVRVAATQVSAGQVDFVLV